MRPASAFLLCFFTDRHFFLYPTRMKREARSLHVAPARFLDTGIGSSGRGISYRLHDDWAGRGVFADF